MVYIDKVHYSTDSLGYEVISNVKWTKTLTEDATNECSKRQMIDFINKNPNVTKTKYKNPWGNWQSGEDVRVVDNSYLRTDSNNIKKDNLENLPRY
jgi:hypothetical protein